jgi:hypothetical protein
LTHLQYVSKAEAARKTALTQQTANDIKRRAAERKAIHEELGLRPPTIEQQITRKLGSSAKPKISVNKVTKLLEAYTLNKKQRKKI